MFPRVRSFPVVPSYRHEFVALRLCFLLSISHHPRAGSSCPLFCDAISIFFFRSSRHQMPFRSLLCCASGDNFADAVTLNSGAKKAPSDAVVESFPDCIAISLILVGARNRKCILNSGPRRCFLNLLMRTAPTSLVLKDLRNYVTKHRCPSTVLCHYYSHGSSIRTRWARSQRKNG